jgi:hypothetical protein
MSFNRERLRLRNLDGSSSPTTRMLVAAAPDPGAPCRWKSATTRIDLAVTSGSG